MVWEKRPTRLLSAGEREVVVTNGDRSMLISSTCSSAEDVVFFERAVERFVDELNAADLGVARQHAT